MDITNRLKRRIRAREDMPVGTWLMSGAPSTAEAMGHCGFDFLVVDMEHVPVDTPQLADILRAVAATPAEAIVRLPWNDRVMVKRALDAGAMTIMLPFVETGAEASAAVAATKYPPDGVRGVAAVHRGSAYGAATEYLTRANAETCVIAQIETPEALGRLEEIAAVPGLDAIFVGPGDMAAALGHIGRIGEAEVQEVLRAAADKARSLDLPVGIVGPSPQMVRAFAAMGYTYAAIGSDIALMTGRARAALGEIRGEAAPGRAPTAAY